MNTLIGPHTVNTVPPKTLDAFRDHGVAEETITRQMDQGACLCLANWKKHGISMDVVTQELEDEGVKAFADAFTALLETIEERRAAAASQLGPLAASVSKRIAKLEKDSVPARLWDGDPTLWTTDKKGQAEIEKRLGWLRLPETSIDIVARIGRICRRGPLRGHPARPPVGYGRLFACAGSIVLCVCAADDPDSRGRETLPVHP